MLECLNSPIVQWPNGERTEGWTDERTNERTENCLSSNERHSAVLPSIYFSILFWMKRSTGRVRRLSCQFNTLAYLSNWWIDLTYSIFLTRNSLFEIKKNDESGGLLWNEYGKDLFDCVESFCFDIFSIVLILFSHSTWSSNGAILKWTVQLRHSL